MTLNGPFSQPEEGALFFVQFVILAKARIQSVALTPTLSQRARELKSNAKSKPNAKPKTKSQS